MACGWLASSFGDVSVFVEDGAVVAVEWGRGPETAPGPGLELALRELAARLRGDPITTCVPLNPRGSVFQLAVWKHLMAIPRGTTTTYGALANALGSAPRAVAGACARNPIPIMIPCHRVLGAGGAVSGYSGGEGPPTKRALLALEGVTLAVGPAGQTERHAREETNP